MVKIIRNRLRKCCQLNQVGKPGRIRDPRRWRGRRVESPPARLGISWPAVWPRGARRSIPVSTGRPVVPFAGGLSARRRTPDRPARQAERGTSSEPLPRTLTWRAPMSTSARSDVQMALRWCAAEMGGAAKLLRRVNGHLHLAKLREALDAHSAGTVAPTWQDLTEAARTTRGRRPGSTELRQPRLRPGGSCRSPQRALWLFGTWLRGRASAPILGPWVLG